MAGGASVNEIEKTTSSASGQGLPPTAALSSLFLCILFGANAVAIKISLGGLGVFTSAGLRFGLAAATIWCWARLTGKPLSLNRKQRLQLAPLGLIFFVQLSLFYLGIYRTTASHGTLITNALPFVVMVLAHVFLVDDRISWRKVGGLVLGFTGVVLLFIDSIGLTAEVVQGDLLVLLAVVVWGSNAVYSKRIIAAFQPLQFTVYPMLMAAPLFLMCGVFVDPVMIKHFDTTIAAALFYQTFVTAAFGMVAWNTLIKRYGATALHAFVFVMPISGVTLGVLLLGEPLTVNLVAAIIFVSLGLLVINRRRPPLSR
ncbi:MAG: DMT family transporter [Desulfobulbaceae bacterium]|nr:DMT family transporter [Desulfobulbaceae bacterium]